MLSSNRYTTSLFCVLADPRETRRVDTYLSALFPEKSRSYIQKMIEDGKISCNGESFTKNKKIYRGNVIEISWDIKPMELIAEDIPLDIIYENDDFAIINKDAGMNTHPTPGEEGRRGTLVNALLHHFQSLGVRSDEMSKEEGEENNGGSEGGKLSEADESSKKMSGANEFLSPSGPFGTFQSGKVQGVERGRSIINGIERPGIVHRLDKDTSGLLVIAKNDKSMHALQLKMAKRTIKKTYLALVVGKVKEQEGYIESFIGRDPNDRKKMSTTNPLNPKIAKTKFRNRGYIADKYTLLEVDLLTGRTHQIRVHLASIGHPIIGDKTYGNEKANKDAYEQYGLSRQWLHAWKLAFTLFGEEYLFEAPIKQDIQKFLPDTFALLP